MSLSLQIDGQVQTVGEFITYHFGALQRLNIAHSLLELDQVAEFSQNPCKRQRTSASKTQCAWLTMHVQLAGFHYHLLGRQLELLRVAVDFQIFPLHTNKATVQLAAVCDITVGVAVLTKLS